MSDTAKTVPNFQKTESTRFTTYEKAKVALDALNKKIESSSDKRARIRRRSNGSFDVVLYARPKPVEPKKQVQAK